MRTYKVTYNIGYGGDSYVVSQTCTTIEVKAKNRKEAAEAAIKWAHDYDYRTDIDCCVHVLRIQAVPKKV